MFKDISLSISTMDKFKEWLQRPDTSREPVEVDLTVRVLTTGYWPTQSPPGCCNIPPAARLAYDTFSKYYLSSHTGRRLTLQANLGFADLNATFYTSIEKKHVLQACLWHSITKQFLCTYLFAGVNSPDVCALPLQQLLDAD